MSLKNLHNPTSQKLTTALLISSYSHVSLSVSLAVSDSFCYTNKHSFYQKGIKKSYILFSFNAPCLTIQLIKYSNILMAAGLLLIEHYYV